MLISHFASASGEQSPRPPTGALPLDHTGDFRPPQRPTMWTPSIVKSWVRLITTLSIEWRAGYQLNTQRQWLTSGYYNNSVCLPSEHRNIQNPTKKQLVPRSVPMCSQVRAASVRLYISGSPTMEMTGDAEKKLHGEPKIIRHKSDL